MATGRGRLVLTLAAGPRMACAWPIVLPVVVRAGVVLALFFDVIAVVLSDMVGIEREARFHAEAESRSSHWIRHWAETAETGAKTGIRGRGW